MPQQLQECAWEIAFAAVAVSDTNFEPCFDLSSGVFPFEAHALSCPVAAPSLSRSAGDSSNFSESRTVGTPTPNRIAMACNDSQFFKRLKVECPGMVEQRVIVGNGKNRRRARIVNIALGRFEDEPVAPSQPQELEDDPFKM